MATIYTRANTKVLYCRFTFQGKEVRLSTRETDFKKAQRRAAELEKAYKLRATSSPTTIVEAFDTLWSWLETRRKPNTVYKYRVCVGVFTDYLKVNHPKVKLISQITPETISAYVEHRLSSTSYEVGTRYHLEILRTCFNLMLSWKTPPLSSNPVSAEAVHELKAPDRREVYLKRSHIDLLMRSTTHRWQADVIQMAAETGMRKTEIRLLTWRNVDLIGREVLLHVEQTKVSRARVIPLQDTTVRMLQHRFQHRPSGSPYVFTTGEGRPFHKNVEWWNVAKRRAGLSDLHFHDLRHYYATWWLSNGGGEFHLQRILGHNSNSMTRRYVHLRSEDLHNELREVQRTAHPV